MQSHALTSSDYCRCVVAMVTSVEDHIQQTNDIMTAVQLYVRLCRDSQVDAALEFVNSLSTGAKECFLGDRATPLLERDVMCIAEALRLPHTIRTLDLDGNRAGMRGTQALLAALTHNPSVRELRLGHNDLGDPTTVVLGSTLANTSIGLRVLDVSLNSIGKIGCLSLCQALSSRACEISEISLHGNNLDADCGIAIAQAIRQSTKLKHLHLGFNSLRDAGAVHIARALTSNRVLASLDLTGNGIGPQGGKEIALAISAGSMLQRLNLRQNNFDDETFNLFADVLRNKSCLTHLCLGQMRPSPTTAENVFRSLAANDTIVAFEATEWELTPGRVDNCLRTIGAMNHVIRSITTEAFTGETSTVQVINENRQVKNLPPLYVGIDERQAHAAVSAAASLSAAKSESAPRSVAVTVPDNAAAVPPPAPQSKKPIPVLIGDDEELKLIIRGLESCSCECKTEVVALAQHYHLKFQTMRSTHQQQLFELSERVRLLENKAQQASALEARRPTEPAPDSRTESSRNTSLTAFVSQMKAITGPSAIVSETSASPSVAAESTASSRQVSVEPRIATRAPEKAVETKQEVAVEAVVATATQSTAPQSNTQSTPHRQNTPPPQTSSTAASPSASQPSEPPHNSTPVKPVHHPSNVSAAAETRSPSLQHSRGHTHEATTLGHSPPKQDLPKRRGLRLQTDSHK
jgi:hypothetical protein